MLPRVLMRDASGSTQELLPGDLIGRGLRCAIKIDDPRISEAHAMLSLRAEAFWLLGLRGTLWNGVRWTSEVRLEEGGVVRLADGIELEVAELHLPPLTLAIEGLGEGPLLLRHPTVSIHASGEVSPSYEGTAHAWIWTSDGMWVLRDREGALQVLEVGQEITIGDLLLRIVGVPIGSGNAGRTVRHRASHPPLVIEIMVEATRIRTPENDVHLAGRPHDLLRQAALLTRERGGPVHWQDVAGAVWKANPTPENWYRNRARLAAKLKRCGLPGDLLQVHDGIVSLLVRDGVDELLVRDAREP